MSPEVLVMSESRHSAEQLERELSYLYDRLRLVAVLKDACERGTTHPDLLKKFFGLTDEEIEWAETEVPEIKVSPPRARQKLEEVEQRLRDHIWRLLAEALKDYELVIVPNVFALLGKKVKIFGLYRGQPVKEVRSSMAAVFSRGEVSWKGATGEELAFVGPGVYYVEFEIEPRGHMVLSVPIHGILVNRDLLTEKLEGAPSISREAMGRVFRIRFPEVLSREKLIARRHASYILNKCVALLDAFIRALRAESEAVPSGPDDVRMLSLLKELPGRLLVTEQAWEKRREELAVPGLVLAPGLEKLHDLLSAIPLELVRVRIFELRERFLKYGALAIYELL